MATVALVGGGEVGEAHDTGPGHPERAARLAAVAAGIGEAGVSDAIVELQPRPATRDELLRVHRSGYLDSLSRLAEAGGGELDPDTPVGPGSWRAALVAAGAGLTAVSALREGVADAAFVSVRPPGHHARPAGGMGFCLLNNVAVTAAALADAGEAVLVVDWDVHHGNGTQEVFWDDPRVLFASVHQWPLFPGTGRATETGGARAPGLTVNVPLPPGATGDCARAALDDVVGPAVESFQPTWVLVSAGFDAHRRDPLGSLEWTSGDYADLAATVARWAPSPGRLVAILEGGYDLQALAWSAGATVAALAGSSYRPEPASAGGPGREAVRALAERRRDGP